MSNIPVKGRIHAVLVDKYGNVKSDQTCTNLITNLFDAHIANMLADQDENRIRYMAIGSGTGQGAADVDLSNYVDGGMIALSGTGSPTQGAGAADNDIVYSAYWGAGVGTGSIREAGIFRESGTVRSGLMAYNDAISVNKGASDTLKIDWTITIGSS